MLKRKVSWPTRSFPMSASQCGLASVVTVFHMLDLVSQQANESSDLMPIAVLNLCSHPWLASLPAWYVLAECPNKGAMKVRGGKESPAVCGPGSGTEGQRLRSSLFSLATPNHNKQRWDRHMQEPAWCDQCSGVRNAQDRNQIEPDMLCGVPTTTEAQSSFLPVACSFLKQRRKYCWLKAYWWAGSIRPHELWQVSPGCLWKNYARELLSRRFSILPGF